MRTTRIRGSVLARLVACAALSLAILTATVRMAAAAPVPGSYDWPVRARVMRPFVAPAGQFGPGHRGIDIEAPFGSVIVAPQDGVVGFAGWVAGSQFVSIDHPDGVRTTYSWLSAILVRRGDPVARGHAIARTGHGHAGDSIPHLHFGARFEGEYIDPMLLLQPAEVRGLIRLAPLDDDGGGSASSALPTLAEFVGGRSAGFEAPAGFEGSTRTMAARPDRECARCRLTTHMTFPGPAGTGARGPPGGLAGHRIDARARPLRPVRQ